MLHNVNGDQQVQQVQNSRTLEEIRQFHSGKTRQRGFWKPKSLTARGRNSFLWVKGFSLSPITTTDLVPDRSRGQKCGKTVYPKQIPKSSQFPKAVVRAHPKKRKNQVNQRLHDSRQQGAQKQPNKNLMHSPKKIMLVATCGDAESPNNPKGRRRLRIFEREILTLSRYTPRKQRWRLLEKTHL